MIYRQSCAVGHELPVVSVSKCATSSSKARNPPAVDTSAPMSGGTCISLPLSSVGTSADLTVGQSAQISGVSANAGVTYPSVGKKSCGITNFRFKCYQHFNINIAVKEDNSVSPLHGEMAMMTTGY